MLIGEEAKKTVNKLLKHGNIGKHHDDYGKPYVAGYFHDKYNTGEACVTAFDNTDGSCFVEAFDTVAEALMWCKGEFEIGGNKNG